MTNRLLLICSILVFTAIHPEARAQTSPELDPYFEIGEVTTEVTSLDPVPLTEETLESIREDNVERVDGLGPMAIADLLIKAWELIVKNKPVVHVETRNASALPNLAQADWRVLTGWNPERIVEYHLQVKNLYKMKVIDFKYKLKLLAGGSVRGKGLYIASARIVPDVTALWAFNLDVAVNVPSIVNLGTEEEPIAGIYIDVTSKVKSVFKTSSYTQSYFVKGDGLVKNQKTDEVYFEPFNAKKIP